LCSFRHRQRITHRLTHSLRMHEGINQGFRLKYHTTIASGWLWALHSFLSTLPSKENVKRRIHHGILSFGKAFVQSIQTVFHAKLYITIPRHCPNALLRATVGFRFSSTPPAYVRVSHLFEQTGALTCTYIPTVRGLLHDGFTFPYNMLFALEGYCLSKH
jgi:hypothetical protein